VENYPEIKENEPLIHETLHATTRMNLSDITLNKRTQTQKSTFHVISLTGSFQKAKTGTKIIACQGTGGNWAMEMSYCIDGSGSYTGGHICPHLSNCTLKMYAFYCV